jgi:hypothetical protein
MSVALNFPVRGGGIKTGTVEEIKTGMGLGFRQLCPLQRNEQFRAPNDRKWAESGIRSSKTPNPTAQTTRTRPPREQAPDTSLRKLRKLFSGG